MYLFFPPTERDLPVGLDQKIITWELVQKENYLIKLEQERKESNEERLKATSNKVDNLSKYLSGLKEQEKRLKVIESQISYCTAVISSMADALTKTNLFCKQTDPNYTCLRNASAEVPLPERAEREENADPTEADITYIDN